MTDLGFDPDALREKYRQERDKRLRVDGNEQYVEVAGEFAHYVDDPYVEPFEREPLTDAVDVVVIGGGFGGLLAGARLRQAGIEDIRIIEKGGDFGGTWYWNRYPGAMCDVESYIYLPLLEEIGYVPKEKYSHAPEILAHSQAIGKHFDLYANACFQTEVTELRWDDESARWIVSTNRGDAMRARFVCMANGPLHRPKLPGIPGIDTFTGHTFHTSRWDYDYTGGDCDGNLTGLAGKRVGIIGTGATAVQCVPHLGDAAEHLYVFQRTPSSIDVRANRPTDPGVGREPRARLAEAPDGQLQQPRVRRLRGRGSRQRRLDRHHRQAARHAPQPDRRGHHRGRHRGNARARRLREDGTDPGAGRHPRQRPGDGGGVEAVLPPVLQAAVLPRRVPRHVQPSQRDAGRHRRAGASSASPNEGWSSSGVEYELDCLIYATGFEVGTDFTRRAGYEIVGRDGVTLTDKWADGARTFHGLFSRGFPNCFIISLVQSGFSVNFPHMLNEQAKHIAYILHQVMENDVNVVETSQEAEDGWVQTILDLAQNNLDFLESCTPGYYNNEGKPAERSGQDGFYGGGSIAFIRVLEAWRAEGSLAGLELTS